MRKSVFLIILVFMVSSCGKTGTNKKRNLDDTLFKYASLIRWSDFDQASRFIHPKSQNKPSSFELEKLKQFKVSRYLESPITPGSKENEIRQAVEITLYNIHTNNVKTIHDFQTWEYSDDLSQWLITSGLPKL